MVEQQRFSEQIEIAGEMQEICRHGESTGREVCALF